MKGIKQHGVEIFKLFADSYIPAGKTEVVELVLPSGFLPEP
jgi:hypothetical protein